jgi:anti-anti-sigma factor
MTTTNHPARSGPFQLEGNLDLYAAERLHAALSEALADGDEVTLDLAGVVECDASGVQLLMSARTTAAAHRKTLHLLNLPESITRCCTRLGLPVLN